MQNCPEPLLPSMSRYCLFFFVILGSPQESVRTCRVSDCPSEVVEVVGP
jgi:hypothetical protein